MPLVTFCGGVVILVEPGIACLVYAQEHVFSAVQTAQLHDQQVSRLLVHMT